MNLMNVRGGNMRDSMQRRRPRALWVIAAVVTPLAYGLISRWIFGDRPTSQFLSTISVAFLCLMPAGVGALAVYLANYSDRLTPWKAFTLPFAPALLLYVALLVFNTEAAICLFMAAPLYLMVAGTGGLIMYGVLKSREENRTISVSILIAMVALPYLVGPLEKRGTPPNLIRTVETQITVNANRETVWNSIIRVPRITDQYPSLFQVIGIPRPLQATLTGEGVGAIRHGIFEHDLVFVERISQWQPGEAVAFDIAVDRSKPLSSPLNQIGGKYFGILGAAYRIEAISGEQVILHLTSTYRLTTPINFYGSVWTDLIMRDFQNYVLEAVKRRAEMG
jgi:hypothetical protein